MNLLDLNLYIVKSSSRATSNILGLYQRRSFSSYSNSRRRRLSWPLRSYNLTAAIADSYQRQLAVSSFSILEPYSSNERTELILISVMDTSKFNENIQQVKRVVFAEKKGSSTGEKPAQLALSLSGCGFLGSYHFGVILCFQKHAKELMKRVTHYCGASAGSLLAALLVFAPNSLEDGLNQLFKLADEVHSKRFGALTPGTNMASRLAHIVDAYLPEDISGAQGRLFVSLTRKQDRTNRMISTFPDREYLIKCLNASCYIPVYSNSYFEGPPEIDGEAHIDGGYSNNLPVLEDIPTITISPFSGSAMIAPQDQNMFDWKMRLGNQHLNVNMHNLVRGAQALFPPKTAVLRSYYAQGYRDAMQFLVVNDFFEREEGTEV